MNVTGMQSSLNGIHSGFQQLRNNAHTIASNSVEQSPTSKENTDAIVGLTVNQQQVEFNAKALKVQDDMLGTLLDELA